MNSVLMNSLPLSLSYERTTNGRRSSARASTQERLRYALFLADAFSIHPVAKSNAVRVRQNSPSETGAVRDSIGLHVAQQSVQFVARFPDRDQVAQQLARRAGGRQPSGPYSVAYRSKVLVNRDRAHRHKLMEFVPVIGVETTHARSTGSHWGNIAFRYLPHDMSVITRTSRNSSRNRAEYRLGRSGRRSSAFHRTNPPRTCVWRYFCLCSASHACGRG